MQILSRNEASDRSGNIELSSVDVTVDVSGAPELAREDYPVTSRLALTTAVPRLFIDVAGRVDAVRIDGEDRAFTAEEDRVWIDGVPTGAPVEIEVDARCRYSRTGEGLHRYQDPEDGLVYLYTQFEPNDAHRAWPCIDQPDVKPRWTFHVTAPAGWVVSSNGPLDASEELPGAPDSVRHDFGTTPPLSSYITALVAGPWAVVDGGHWQGGAADGGHADLRLRLMCRKALEPFIDSDDILEVTRAGLDFYHARYGTTYPWGAYDQVFVPEYNLGAMENPGCVTFNETYLSRTAPTLSERQRRANTILHEMCHMWFGDLVTPAWWDDLWLKESFAENQGATAAAAATRYRGEWASFAVNRKAWAYEQDQMPTTHPIAADIPDVAAAKTNFDGITYAKGAAVLKQLVAWVGEDAFYAGARRYFQDHAFGATRLGDLLAALEAASGRSLEQWKGAWLETTGPSVLSASWSTGPFGEVTDFTLHQSGGASGGVLRPHRLVVSTWKFGGGRLEATHSFDVRIEGESAPIDPEGALAHPGGAAEVDMVVVNDQDLTYAVSRLDPHSTDVALAYAGTCPEAITRAVVWAALWNALRDGLVDPRRFVQSALVAVESEAEPAVRDRLLALAHSAIRDYLPGGARQGLRELLSAATIRYARETGDADAARAFTRAFITEFEAYGPGAFTELVRGYAAGDDIDLAWRARCALAARGLVDADGITAWRDADGSGEAQRHAARALASLPDAGSRAAAWESVFSGALSNDILSATLAGLAASSWEGDAGTGAAIDRMEEFWQSHTIGMSLRYVRGVLAVGLDIDRPGTVAQTLDALRAWLDSHEGAPAQLRRVVVEHCDSYERSRRVQEAWKEDR